MESQHKQQHFNPSQKSSGVARFFSQLNFTFVHFVADCCWYWI